jgi:hypothetical protein
VPFVAPPGVALPEGVQLATRWIPLDVRPVPGDADRSMSVDAAPADPDPATPADPGPSPSVDPDPVPSAEASPSSDPAVPPPVDLVVPESPGDVVEPQEATGSDTSVSVETIAPRAPGLYRLVVTLHGPDGRAYDAATQSLVEAVIVRVSLPLSVRFGVPADARVAPAGLLQLAVRVTNTGRIPWELGMEPGTARRGDRIVLEEPVLIASWFALDGDEQVAPSSVTAVHVAPGSSEVVTVGVIATLRPGSYLVVLDVRAPLFGSLVASGIDPGIIRIEVLEASPSTDPTGTAT